MLLAITFSNIKIIYEVANLETGNTRGYSDHRRGHLSHTFVYSLPLH
jgi:hypothetical protein